MRTRRTGSMTVDKEIATIEKLPLSEDCFVIFTVRLQRVAARLPAANVIPRGLQNPGLQFYRANQ